ncbi:MAG TPA: ATP-binding protein [Acidimicrobiia bacterium]|nr:ATP-binding protein [Acidimicrobiia bacterium]
MSSLGTRPGPGSFESVSTVFPSVPPSVASARRFVEAALRRWDVDPDAADIALLLTSELVTNSYRHAARDAQVSVVHRPGVVRVEVHDTGGGRVQRRPLDPERADGRGLNIVDALATRWGSTTSESGTLVWFELATDDQYASRS